MASKRAWTWLACLALLSPGVLGACERTEMSAIADGISVAVLIDGAPGPVIDSARLRRVPPDYTDAERRAWRLSTLLPNRYDPETMDVALEDPSGERHALMSPADGRQRVVVVAINRAGALRVAAVSPDKPFPDFHGRGGNRGRQGDPSRIKDVKRIVVTPAAAAPATASAAPAASAAADPLALEVRIDGRTLVWTRADLAKVPARAFTPGDGQGARDAWSLRDLSRTLIGSGAWISAVHGERAKVVAITPEQWRDDSRTPLLRLNRDGQLKFMWVDRALEALPGEELRRVGSLTAHAEAAP